LIKDNNRLNDEVFILNSQRIRNWPSKERPRERLLAEGPEQLTDAELLAIILRVGLGTFKKGIAVIEEDVRSELTFSSP
jgi:hypothetical protein